MQSCREKEVDDLDHTKRFNQVMLHVLKNELKSLVQKYQKELQLSDDSQSHSHNQVP